MKPLFWFLHFSSRFWPFYESFLLVSPFLLQILPILWNLSFGFSISPPDSAHSMKPLFWFLHFSSRFCPFYETSLLVSPFLLQILPILWNLSFGFSISPPDSGHSMNPFFWFLHFCSRFWPFYETSLLVSPFLLQILPILWNLSFGFSISPPDSAHSMKPLFWFLHFSSRFWPFYETSLLVSPFLLQILAILWNLSFGFSISAPDSAHSMKPLFWFLHFCSRFCPFYETSLLVSPFLLQILAILWNPSFCFSISPPDSGHSMKPLFWCLHFSSRFCPFYETSLWVSPFLLQILLILWNLSFGFSISPPDSAHSMEPFF